ncbi:MAG: ATP-dependent helicase RecQ [Frankiales bacterium]|jgi:ATP-dependent DNA helicase RecQ|nr:ATP-dependent helicase RecQ [Frankiales bacterium]
MPVAPLDLPTTTDETALRAEAEVLLRSLAGPGTALREDQWNAVRALVVDRRPTLVVQRTGWGKSAVYFVATALLRARGAGATVIVSPLLALMRNQMEAAARAGIVGRTINSANIDEWDAVRAEVAAGEVDVLLVSPERLNNPDFRDTVLPSLAASAGLVVIDEAHCVSDWGHDFRPDYRRIASLLAGLPLGTPVLATTATANARVTADVAEQLGSSGTLVLRGSLDRASLRLGVLELPSTAHRWAWLADHLADLPGSGIVYTLTVAAAEEVTGFLRSRGHTVAAYSGRTDDAERQAAEADLLANRVKALVATSALGMGFDKPDLGFVVHLGAPQSPIAYYQQVGRAGRAVDDAVVVLLPGREDAAIWRYFASLAFPSEEQVRQALDVLTEAGRPMSTAALETRVDLRRTRLETMLKVLDVDGAVRRVRGGWTATGQAWAYDGERYARVAEARGHEQQAMRDYVATDGCRMAFLRGELDDPEASPCGRCDGCGSLVLAEAISAEALTAAQSRLDQPGIDIEPRRMWPSGMAAVGVPVSGKIPGDLQAEPGRALARLSDPGWGERVRTTLAAEDNPAPEDMVKALVRVLATWGWAQRPSGIVAIASRRRPALIGSVAAALGEVGKLPVLGTVSRRHDEDRGGRGNSAQRLRSVWGSFEVGDELAEAIATLEGSPVLLFDDLVDTGWTFTVVTALLRERGAGRVLPLALGQEG